MQPSRIDTDVPGAAMLGAVPALGAALIAVNDLWLRRHGPGWLSGKLSDVGICLLFPVLLLATAQWLAWATRWSPRWRPSAPAAAALACLIAGAYFAGLETIPALAIWHSRTLTLVGLAVHPTADATDLFALLALPVAYFAIIRSCAICSRSGAPP
jgi:hypothetical protein